MCGHFLDCIRSGKEPRSSGTDGEKVVRILTAAQDSLRNGSRRVSMKQFAPEFCSGSEG